MNTTDDGNGGMTMIFGANGFAVESAESNVTVVYNPQRRQIDIRSGHNASSDSSSKNKVSLNVEGKIYCDDEKDLLTQIEDMKKQIEEMKEEITRLNDKLTEVYYAPGMPGFLCAEQEFSELQEHSLVHEVATTYEHLNSPSQHPSPLIP